MSLIITNLHRPDAPVSASSFVYQDEQPSWFRKHATRIAGVGLGICDALLFASGAYNRSTLSALSGISFGAGDLSFFGLGDRGQTLGLFFSLMGATFSTLPDLARGHILPIIAVAGYSVLTAVSYFRERLQEQFQQSSNRLLRLMGNPQMMIGTSAPFINLSLALNFPAGSGKWAAFLVGSASLGLLAFSAQPERSNPTPATSGLKPDL